jgi:hypothetical protein
LPTVGIRPIALTPRALHRLVARFRPRGRRPFIVARPGLPDMPRLNVKRV